MTIDEKKAEEYLRKHAKILCVAKPHHFAQGVSLDPLDPDKVYLLAIMEVE